MTSPVVTCLLFIFSAPKADHSIPVLSLQNASPPLDSRRSVQGDLHLARLLGIEKGAAARCRYTWKKVFLPPNYGRSTFLPPAHKPLPNDVGRALRVDHNDPYLPEYLAPHQS